MADHETGFSPYQLVFGRGRAVVLEGKVAKVLQRRISAEMDHKNRGLAIRLFTVGDRV